MRPLLGALAFVCGGSPRRRRCVLEGKKQKLMTDILDQAFGADEVVRRGEGSQSGDSEMSRCFDVVNLRQRLQTSIEASPEELQAIAERFDVTSISNLTAQVALFVDKKVTRVEGDASAVVAQPCVVTNVPVAAPVATRFELVVGDDDDEIPYDAAGKLDVGELVLQYLCLQVDPYPRAVGLSDETPLASFVDDDVAS